MSQQNEKVETQHRLASENSTDNWDYLWNRVQLWYGDVKKSQTHEEFAIEMKSKFRLNRLEETPSLQTALEQVRELREENERLKKRLETAECEHNEVMKQGNGFVYSYCSKCLKEL